MKKLLLLPVFILATVFTWAQGPNNSGTYYQSANGKSGQALKTAMYQIINPHTSIGYDGLWTAYAKTDKRADGKLRDWYSNATNFVIGGSAQGHSYSGEGDGYNREHSVPQSWFNKANPMKCDVVHVLPTDGYVNNRRGSYPFGEVKKEKIAYSSANGYSKLGSCATSGYTGTVFEPNDEIKGDIARIYFYMATCYEDRITNWSGTVITGTAYQPYAQWHFDMLMRWSKQDPVDEIEIARNNAVWEVQNNRNPFVDYPGLEDYVWGDKKTENFSYDNYSGAIVYTIATPVISPSTGTYEDAQTVIITCATSGATIHYTIDGTTPTASSPVYSAPFVVSENTVIQAKAYNGDEQSATAIVTITIGSGGGDGPVVVGEGTFKLITSTADLEAGKRYLLVGKNSGTLKAYNGADSNKGKSSTVTATNDVIDLNASGNTAVPIVLGGSTNNWSLYDTAGAVYLAGVSSNGLAFETETSTAATQWTVQSINASSGETKLKNNGYTMYLQFNTGSNIFRCYSSGQKDIYFYKEQEAASSVPTPTFSPAAGTYNEAQTVSITCSDTEAAIYYTLDGTNPTASSTPYTTPIIIEESCYLKAIAIKGEESSKVGVAEYVIITEEDESDVLKFQKVTSVTPGKRYLIVYDISGTLKAQNPETGTATYSYLKAATTVVDNNGIIEPDDESNVFTFEAASGGFYLKDNNGRYYYQSGSYNNFNNQTSVPASGGVWSATSNQAGTFTITNTTTNKWIQYSTQYNSSGAYSSTQSNSVLPYLYEEVESTTPVTPTVADPVFNPAAGTYDAVQSVTITCATEGAKIYYTTNLSTPTVASTLYEGPITVDETTTIKAIAVKEGYNSSNVITTVYTIDIPITYTSVPQFTPAPGTYNEPQNVTISCNSTGANIYYTTDGTEPTVNSTLYQGETIVVSSTMTIKAFAVETGSEPSFVVTAEYIINDGSSVGTGKFRRITSADELESGKNYLIVYDASEDNPTTAEVFNGVTSGNIGDHVSVAVSDLTIDNSVDGGHVIVLEKSGESWTMKDGDVYLAYTSPATTKNNYLWAVSDATADGTLWTISFSGVDAKIENDFNTTRTLYYNTQNPRFACYIASSAQAAIQLYKEIESQTETVVVGETEYASMYYGTENLIVPDGVNCSTYKINQNGELVESWVYEPGDVIPAGTGVIVKATTQNYQFVVTSETGDVDNENMLRGSDVDEETTGGAAYFRLSLNAAEEAGSIGFYYGAANGGAFTNMAHKAYLAVPSSLVGKLKASGYPFHDTSTGITGIDNDTTNKNEAIYTLDGRRVVSTSLPKGIYIRNGKKFIVK